MSLTDQFIERAKKSPKRIVLPEGDDERMVQAASRLAAQGIARPILIGDADAIAQLAAGAPLDGVTIVNPSSCPNMDRYVAAYAKTRGVAEGIAKRLVKRPLYFAGMMAAEGDADAMVAGVAKATAQVISAAALTVGFAEGISQASSFFLMVLPGTPERVLVFADSAVVVDPTARELAEIAVATAGNAQKLLGMEPRVAMLSFSTKGSAQHPRVDKVREATEIAKQMAPQFAIDGEFQVDSAIVERVAKKKCPDSAVGGTANVLIFPDLDSGNMGYKLTQYLGGAQAIGPVMQGFAKPVNDLSRGASVDDIIAVAAIASLQCG
ncbi:MAG: phosphate acetyltransferase [Candidatus Sumerlaeota bacterium]|nr:phosphate acetyltransferase [Candidatus Sumerlaeota bacterium]